MSLFRFGRLNELDDIDVVAEISATNRMLERRFPDCTVQRVDVGDYGQGSQWVTVELEVTPQSLGCEEWYATELERKKIVVQSTVKRRAFGM